MGRILMALAGTLVIGGRALGQDADPVSLRTASGLLHRGLFDLAAKEYAAFLSDNPSHAKSDDARYGLAVSLFRLGRLEDAAEQLNVLADLDSFAYHADVLTMSAHIALRSGDAERAVELCEWHLRSHAGHATSGDVASMLVEARYRAGQFEGAEHEADAFVQAYPEHPSRDRVELIAGLSAIARSQDAPAAARLERLLSRAPQGEYAPRATLALAQCQHRLGRFQAARMRYAEVLRFADESLRAEALLGIGQTAHAMGDASDAAEAIDELLRGGGRDGELAAAELLRGRLSLESGDIEGAKRMFARALDREDEASDMPARYWLAKCDLRAGRADVAASALGQLVQGGELGDLEPEAEYDLAVALSRSGQDEAARDRFEAFAEAHHDHSMAGEALLAAAGLAHREGDHAAAVELADRASSGRAELWERAQFIAAESLYLSGGDEEALGRYRELIEAGQDRLTVSLSGMREGLILARTGQFDEARPELEAAASLAHEDDRFAPAALALADGFFERESWSEAESWYQRFLSTNVGESSLDDSLMRIALCRMRRGEHASAIETLDRLLKERPQSEHAIHARFERAQALVALGDDRATGALSEVVALDRGGRFATLAMKHLAGLAMNSGDVESAAALYGRLAAEATDPTEIGRLRLREGQALSSAGEHADAVEVLTGVIDAGAAADILSEARIYRALSLARLERSGEVVSEVESLIAGSSNDRSDAIDPSMRAALQYEWAWALRDLGRNDEAMRVFRELLNDGGGGRIGSHAALDLASMEMSGGLFEDASARLREICDETGDVVGDIAEQAWYRLGACRFRLDDFEGAVDSLDGFESRFPQSDLRASAMLIRGESLSRLGRHSDAAKSLRAVVDGFADTDSCGPAMLRLGECESALQRWGSAEEVFGSYLKRFKDSELAYQAEFGVAWAEENQGRYDEAIQGYRELVQTHEGATAARAQFQIGECLYAKREFERAITEYLRVDILFESTQWTPAALYEAARCFEELGQADRARQHYGDVVERFAESSWSGLATERLGAMAARTGRTGPPGG